MLRSLLSRGLGVAVAVPLLSSTSHRPSDSLSPSLSPSLFNFAHCASASPSPSVSTDKNHNPDIVIISGTTCKQLSQRVCDSLNRPLSDVLISQFSDGETLVNIQESMRGKEVFIIQTCAPPVNDNIMELLLSIAAAKRSGASSVTAVIPYFGYRLNRRGLPLSTTHHSRFLWNAAGDLAKMLLVVGADKVISVDLQKPGQGHEACFFKTQLPAETISTHDIFVSHFQQTLSGDVPIVVVAPNTELVKKAKKFQRKLKHVRNEWAIDTAMFLRTDADTANSQLLGDVKGKDVVLIEDYIDSAQHITVLCNKLLKEGARKVYVFASHGLFNEASLKLVDLSPLTQVVVTDSIELPKQSCTKKIVQISIAPLLANVIKSDISYHATTEFNPDVSEDQFVME